MEIITTIKAVKADGGTFGSKLNLMKDCAEHTDYKIGKYLQAKIGKALR
ncbi:MAG: hypothetical protein IIV13_09705 [Bacteroidaceae bacterium]|nr:hypothetical protein [Bacteroidaceae bacterium]MBQ5644005.1 hypothetical protein [Bacteroidaceae bacterium]